MRETWYVLEDGNVVDPNTVAPDDDYVLRHTSGVAVAIKNQTPVSRGVDDADAERAAISAAAAEAEKPAAEAEAEKPSKKKD